MSYNYSEAQEKWLTMLETTELPQAKESLRDTGGYCCLGIAYVSQGIEGEYTPCSWKFNGELAYLDKSMVEKLSLRGCEGELLEPLTMEGCECKSLVEFNDAYDWTFKEIAAYIRENPLNVFHENEEFQHNDPDLGEFPEKQPNTSWTLK